MNSITRRPRLHNHLFQRGAAISLATLLLASQAIGAATSADAQTRLLSSCPANHSIENITNTNALACNLVGQEVNDGSLGAEIPSPGEGVTATAVGSEGQEHSLTIEVALDGVIEVESVNSGDETDDHSLGAKSKFSLAESTFSEVDGPHSTIASPLVAASATTASVSRCADSAYKLEGWRWRDIPTLWINTAKGRPSNISVSTWTSTVASAIKTWRYGTNGCGIATSDSGIIVKYGSTTKYESNINGAKHKCVTRDEVSAISFGNLPGLLGLNCTWYNVVTGNAWESDTRISNNSGWSVSLSSCNNQYSLAGVTVHEIGHMYGLNHAPERGGHDLTMSPVSGTCDFNQQYLGYGDVRGIHARYS